MIFVAGLGYGDEGKGSVVDFLSSQTGSKQIIRYNGGPQAAHNVVHNGYAHCFSQIGSSFEKGVDTYLSKYMLVDPFALELERKQLNKESKVYINSECIIITPMQKIVGQIRELSNRYGSCGMGIGETVRDSKFTSLKAYELQDKEALQNKLDFIWRVKFDHAEQILGNTNRNLYNKLKTISIKKLTNLYYNLNLNIVSDYNISPNAIFEGAQGVLLDSKYGFAPYITKTDITFNNAYKLGKGKRIGVLRAYSTRHGAGPFVSEDHNLNLPDVYNRTNRWQGKFRIGWLDIVATKYALDVIGGVDTIALTCLDRLKKMKACTSYEYEGEEITNITNLNTEQLNKCKPNYTEFKNEEQFLFFLESELAPISIISRGPERNNKYVNN